MASNVDKRLMEIENSGQPEGVNRLKQYAAAGVQQSVKKQVFGELKNVMQGASATPCGFKASSKQNALPTKVAFTLEQPSVPDEVDYYLIDTWDARTCCSEENHKPDWAVWAEMNGREFEDSGICRNFSFREDSDSSFDDMPQSASDDVDEMLDEALPFFDSVLLDVKDLDFNSIQIQQFEMPELPSDDDDLWF